MDIDQIWRHIDQGRLDFADLFESLTAEQLAAPSLCEGWTVRDVGAHLTMAHARLRDVFWPLVRSGFSFNAMVRRAALEVTLTPAEISATLRSFVGSRRTAVGIRPTEPLIDILVHTQDVAIPLGMHVKTPGQAAIVAIERTFTLPGPMRFTRRYDHVTFEATDVDWRRGTSSTVIRGPIQELLLLLTGRKAACTNLTGPLDLL